MDFSSQLSIYFCDSNPRDFLRRMRYKYTEVSLKIIYLNNDIELFEYILDGLQRVHYI